MNRTYYAVFKFLTEIFLISFLFVFSLKRRKYFVLRLVVCLAISYSISSCWNITLSSIWWLSLIRYFLLFVCVVTTFFVCFDISLKQSLFYACGGYAIQHFTSKVYFMIEPTFLNKIPMYATVFIYVAFISMSYALFYFAVVRRIDDDLTYDKSNGSILIMGFGVVITLIIISVLSNHFKSGYYLPVGLQVIDNLYGMMCSLFILEIQFGIFEKSKNDKEMMRLEQIWQQDQKKMKFSKEVMDIINIKCHDLKHQLNSMDFKLSLQEKQEFRDKINLYDLSVKTGNETLDVIIYEKNIIASSKGIKLLCLADGKALSFMSTLDIYSLFGNAIDNAMEALDKLDVIEDKSISITVRQIKGQVSINVENMYVGDIVFNNGLPVSNKGDKINHGLGTKSMKMIVERYNGVIAYSAKNGVFDLNILLPIK